jgi:hypothetical protein
VVDAFRAVGRESILDLRAFILFHAEERNPLLKRDTFIGYAHLAGDDVREDAERIWGSTLLAFFHERLLPLGGVGARDEGAGGDLDHIRRRCGASMGRTREGSAGERETECEHGAG